MGPAYPPYFSSRVALLSKQRQYSRKQNRSRRLQGHPLQVRHKQDWGRGFILLLPQAAVLPDQMFAVMLISQHRVSSFKTVKPRAPCGTRCIGHAIRTWSLVFSGTPHLQFGEGARPHLCMDEWNCPTPVLKRLSFTEAAPDKPIPTAWHRSWAQNHGA